MSVLTPTSGLKESIQVALPKTAALCEVGWQLCVFVREVMQPLLWAKRMPHFDLPPRAIKLGRCGVQPNIMLLPFGDLTLACEHRKSICVAPLSIAAHFPAWRV